MLLQLSSRWSAAKFQFIQSRPGGAGGCNGPFSGGCKTVFFLSFFLSIFLFLLVRCLMLCRCVRWGEQLNHRRRLDDYDDDDERAEKKKSQQQQQYTNGRVKAICNRPAAPTCCRIIHTRNNTHIPIIYSPHRTATKRVSGHVYKYVTLVLSSSSSPSSCVVYSGPFWSWDNKYNTQSVVSQLVGKTTPSFLSLSLSLSRLLKGWWALQHHKKKKKKKKKNQWINKLFFLFTE